MEHPTYPRVRFGGFELDVQSGELHVAGGEELNRRVVLREQSFQVLRMLIDRAGRIVTRDEIKKTLWPNDTIVDFDHSINTTIKTLRRALGDSADNPRYIGTLARRGYQLLVPVEQVETTAEISRGEIPRQQSLPELTGFTGKKVSHYRVLEVIGGGGMGMVYKAEDLKLGRRVALKFLPEEVNGDPVALRRFEREAQTASSLNHPNICTIYEIEEYEGQPCIVMELLEGETLLHHLNSSDSKTLPPARLLNIAIQICEGLQAAHDKGIIHRDIKPANIFLTKQGPAKILDFGLAKLAESQEFAEDVAKRIPDFDPSPMSGGGTPERKTEGTRNVDVSLTRTGTAMGTAGYMSPEQVRKEKLDGRSDLFSLGLVLFEAAGGRRAFTGETSEAVHNSILHETPVRTRELNPAIPRSFDAVIAKALEKERALRYQSCAEMGKELERVREETQPSSHQTGKWVSAAALLVLTIGFWAYWRSHNRVALARNDTIVLAVDNQTGNPVFDDALYTSLRTGLEQTPYLSVLGAAKVSEALVALHLSADPTKVTPQIAHDVCLRTNSKIVIASTLAEAGNSFRIKLTGIDCQSGKILAQDQNDSPGQNQVIAALGVSAGRLRAKLGEPADSVAKFNQPLDQATSWSPGALRLLTEGYRHHVVGDFNGAALLYQRAVEMDPNLALAYTAMAGAFDSLDEHALAVEAAKKAYALRSRMAEQDRFNVEDGYYKFVTEEQDKDCAILSQWVETYPDNFIAHENLSSCLQSVGQLDRAVAEEREVVRLNPNPSTYSNVARNSIAADQLEDANAALAEAAARKFDGLGLRYAHFLLAFLQKDDAGMREQWKWAEAQPGADYILLDARAHVQSYYGKEDESRRLADQAEALAAKEGALSTSLSFASYEASVAAEVGNAARARRDAEKLLDKIQTHDGRLLLALVFARAGDTAQAQKLSDSVSQDLQSNTLAQNFYLPTIRAVIKLNAKDPARAIELLRPAEKYELAYASPFPDIYPAYVRGLAYLQMGEGHLAVAEFQKLLDHPGTVGWDIVGPLSRLQIARAQKLMGDEMAARNSYGDFLKLWKNADPDLPVYQQSKAEYAKLRASTNRAD